ncbi:MAG TPA: response regulator [Bacteroidia bacterium]|jgi:DNA-binding LytR/AlgR family response regulator|nr:response regulator [Bacteroidia bacterium]
MIQCIVIEDEMPARELLKSYLAELTDWNLVADFDNAIDAISFLSRHPVDVIFLDIQLPKLSGISFIRALEHPPLIVITTAYSDHAVEAFELTVFDYLLKPYPFERFLRTINRINVHLQGAEKDEPMAESGHILLRVDRRNLKVAIAEILFVESQKEYVRIVCTTRELRTRVSITSIEAMLAGAHFLRTHRSFLVAVDKVEAFSGTDVTIGKHVIPIGRLYQRDVRGRLG